MVHIRCRFVQGLSLLVLLLCFSPLVFAQRRQQSDPSVTKLGSGFHSHKAKVSGTTLHYVRGGVGERAVERTDRRLGGGSDHDVLVIWCLPVGVTWTRLSRSAP